ncbi:class I SAM-dependent methyltransferase [Candidatus Woesearchaeota archaeon]|nr:class I SAM-dependent methyltransferase [Candidatus Woesearchaeota archaeon]
MTFHSLKDKKKVIRRRSFKETIKLAVVRTSKQFLMIDLVRYCIALLRFIYFTKIRKRFRVYKGDREKISDNTIFHNFPRFKSLAVIRSNLLIRPLSIIDPIYSRLEQTSVLSIGPKAEGELFNLVGYGFSPSKIRGVDLVSYSPWIDVGDMHHLPYRNNSFDVVMSGWVIEGYSRDPKQAAAEMLRVVRDGGIIAVGIGWSPDSFRQKLKQTRGYNFERRLTSVQDILNLYGNSVGSIYFSQDLREEAKTRAFGQDIMVIFSVKKN